MALRFAIAGGGTGGHVTMGLALAEALAARSGDDGILFIGSDRGLEARLVPEAGFDLVALPSRQVMGRGIAGRALGAASILTSSLRAGRALRRFGADLVVSVGGYAAMPAVLAARLRGTPVVLVEPNAIPGRVNRLTARFARRVFVGFESAAVRLLPGWQPGDTSGRVACEGIPLRAALIERFRAEAEARRRPEAPFRLLVFGGSQGARQINEAVVAALPRLAKLPLEIFHQTGEADRESVAAAYDGSGVAARVVAFEPDMPGRYAWADFAICRSGALAVAELALAGLPALLVPYPFAADDHQSANAEELERAGAARRLDSRALDGDVLADAVESLVAHPERLVAMARASAGLARPGAASAIARACAELAGGRGEGRS